MMSPLLSVLVPRVPGREAPVLADLLQQTEPFGEQVEVLWLGDNRLRTIGAKRQALLELARGDYLAFVDDDDLVAPNYLSEIIQAGPVAARMSGEWPDVVTFDVMVEYEAGWPSCLCQCCHGWEDEQCVPGRAVRRGAWHLHAWRRALAQLYEFPDESGAEDAKWLEKVRRTVKMAAHLDEVLYFYRERAGPSPYGTDSG